MNRRGFLNRLIPIFGLRHHEQLVVTGSLTISGGSGLNLTGTVQISASFQPTPTKVEFYVDNVLAATSTAAPYGFNWDTTLVANGTHIIRAEGVYKSRRTKVQEAVTVANGVTPPPPPPPTSWLAPYSASSIWRTPIPANPAIDPNNANRISYWLAHSIVYPQVATRDWAVAIAIAQPDSPKYTISSTTGWTNTINTLGSVPIPYGTKHDPSADGHLAIYDPATSREYGMWVASYDAAANAWSCGGGQAGSTTTNGIAPVGIAGADAANFPLLGGLLRPEEIEAGLIEHALVFAMPAASTGYVKPATHGTGASFNATALQAGNLLQLDPSVNVDALAIPAWEKTIARALQRYGMYCRDGSGALMIYAENPVNRGETPDKWAQLGFPGLYDMWFSPAFPWSNMRILVPL